MQITPADGATRSRDRSGGTEFEQGDLGTPQINISYGSWYLRWLLDRYGENETLAVAAYNAGTGNVDKWIVADPGLQPRGHPVPGDARVRQEGARREAEVPQRSTAASSASDP